MRLPTVILAAVALAVVVVVGAFVLVVREHTRTRLVARIADLSGATQAELRYAKNGNLVVRRRGVASDLVYRDYYGPTHVTRTEWTDENHFGFTLGGQHLVRVDHGKLAVEYDAVTTPPAAAGSSVGK